MILVKEHLSFERTVSSNPRCVGIRSPVLMNALDSVFFSQGKLELERELYQFGYSQVGAVVCVCVCVWGMSGCVLEIPQYKVRVVDIWEKGAEYGIYKRWVREY